MGKLFLDSDGVLADFERGVKDLTGKLPHELPLSTMWKACARHPNFYGTLHLMPDELGGQALWDAVKHVNPIFLTGIPFGGWAPKQKREWFGRKFGFEYEAIICFAKEKHLHATPGDVLVDDRLKAKGPWESVGGVFVHHKNTKDTLEQLQKIGII